MEEITNTKQTEVVAALIIRGGRFMICQRPEHKARGLLWEFVGGKVEPGETGAQALARECREELDIEVSVGEVFAQVVHEYPDITIRLTVYRCTIAAGTPRLLEHRDLRYITPEEIDRYAFCPADVDILKKIAREYAVIEKKEENKSMKNIQSYPRILTVQDISCLGQCSLTVALPILSACGIETCILPSAVLSTHTGGFHNFTFRDLTDDMPAICRHWKEEGILFDAVYTGYLGSGKQVDCVLSIADTLLAPGGQLIVDPAMADNGKLYTGFDDAFVADMRRLCRRADVLLPNITEASYLTGLPYRETYDKEYVQEMTEALASLCGGSAVLTGVSYEPDHLGVEVLTAEGRQYVDGPRINRMFHGTGDIYASVFTGALTRGKTISEAAQMAVDFTVASIRETLDAPEHWYGVRFERALHLLGTWFND